MYIFILFYLFHYRCTVGYAGSQCQSYIGGQPPAQTPDDGDNGFGKFFTSVS